jgi:hypothetical protein
MYIQKQNQILLPVIYLPVGARRHHGFRRETPSLGRPVETAFPACLSAPDRVAVTLPE